MLASMLAGASISEQPGAWGSSVARICEAFQASVHVKATPEAMEELCMGLQNKLELANGRRVPHRSLVQPLSLPDHW